MKKDTLKEIVLKKKERVLAAQQLAPLEELKARVVGLPQTRPFLEAIRKPRTLSLIAEIKKASPSRGVIREDFNAASIAAIYQEVGVQAISVLTEEDFFQGALAHLTEARNASTLPILRKDFILDEYQVYESRANGADAILLIADLLTKEQLFTLLAAAESLGLDCLVEAHAEKELKKILGISKKVPLFAIGINNRDLHTLEVDFKTTEKLFPMIPRDRVVVVESGIKNTQDALFLKILGASAILVGEAFMEAPDIARKVEELMGW